MKTNLVQFFDPNGVLVAAHYVPSAPSASDIMHVRIPNDYLWSAGQSIGLGIRIVPIDPHPASRSRMPVWTGHLRVDPTFDYRWIPSDRPLWAILEDVVQHGLDYPTHGVDCVCLDRFSYEIKRHIGRTLPDTPEGTGKEWDQAMNARQRIAHILRMVAGNIL